MKIILMLHRATEEDFEMVNVFDKNKTIIARIPDVENLKEWNTYQ